VPKQRTALTGDQDETALLLSKPDPIAAWLAEHDLPVLPANAEERRRHIHRASDVDAALRDDLPTTRAGRHLRHGRRGAD